MLLQHCSCCCCCHSHYHSHCSRCHPNPTPAPVPPVVLLFVWAAHSCTVCASRHSFRQLLYVHQRALCHRLCTCAAVHCPHCHPTLALVPAVGVPPFVWAACSCTGPHSHCACAAIRSCLCSLVLVWFRSCLFGFCSCSFVRPCLFVLVRICLGSVVCKIHS